MLGFVDAEAEDVEMSNGLVSSLMTSFSNGFPFTDRFSSLRSSNGLFSVMSDILVALLLGAGTWGLELSSNGFVPFSNGFEFFSTAFISDSKGFVATFGVLLELRGVAESCGDVGAECKGDIGGGVRGGVGGVLGACGT